MKEELISQVSNLLACFRPEQIEDILFEVFNMANIEGLHENIIAEREILHTKLRQILRTISQNSRTHELFKNDTD